MYQQKRTNSFSFRLVVADYSSSGHWPLPSFGYPSTLFSQVVMCKDADGKVGIRVKAVNKGVFVCLVARNSPAAMGGLRFGDQILQINGNNVAGFGENKARERY